MSEKEQGVVARDQRVHEALCYLQGRRGFFAVLTLRDGVQQHRSYVLQDLRAVLEGLDEGGDVWIRQALFCGPRRRLVNLLRIGLLFSDLDTHKDEALSRLGFEELLGEVSAFCDGCGVPQPSLMIFSGRGLQLKWLFKEALPAHALPRWSRCQRVICERLAPLKADPKACDASRVLRVVGTVNSRSGCEVRVVRGDVGDPLRYEFDALCEALLPYSREEVRVFKAANAAQWAAKRAAIQAAQPPAGPRRAGRGPAAA